MQTQTQPVFFTHPTCINMPSTAPEKRQSPQERSGEGEGGSREERETRQSPGWLFLALIVWDFCLTPFATRCYSYLYASNKLWEGCLVGLISPGLCCKRWTSEGGETARSEWPVKEWRAGMMSRKQRQHWTKLSSCISMKIWNGNSGLEGSVKKSSLNP